MFFLWVFLLFLCYVGVYNYVRLNQMRHTLRLCSFIVLKEKIRVISYGRVYAVKLCFTKLTSCNAKGTVFDVTYYALY